MRLCLLQSLVQQNALCYGVSTFLSKVCWSSCYGVISYNGVIGCRGNSSLDFLGLNSAVLHHLWFAVLCCGIINEASSLVGEMTFGHWEPNCFFTCEVKKLLVTYSSLPFPYKWWMVEVFFK